MSKYRIDLDKLVSTLKVATDNTDKLGVKLMLALKGFPLPAAFPAMRPYIHGVSASGLFEAKLGAAMGRDVHVHAPAYMAEEMPEIIETCSHVVFNSLSQLAEFGPSVHAAGRHVGLRINPGFSFAASLKYDPCCPDSRFGVLAEELEAADPAVLACVDGFHVHALCEGRSEAFAMMVERFTEKFGRFITPAIKWINLGGGEVVSETDFASDRAIAAVKALKALGDFEVYIEPSEYLVRYSGTIEAKVLDILHREKDVAVLDVSLVCHATDAIIYDMRSDILAPALAKDEKNGRRTILGAISCLAGDVIGEYVFEKPLKVGDTVVIGGMGCYSFAQQSWFNGIRHPEVTIFSAAEGEKSVLSWDFSDYYRDFFGKI